MAKTVTQLGSIMHDQPQGQPDAAAAAPVVDGHDMQSIELIELLFFAYRDFIAEPDAILATYGFGRAHHRVLHFVNRNPGLTVAELLDILKITKQSLARVLRQLIDEGFIVQETGTTDRRQRHLHVSEKGAALARQLLGLQMARVDTARREAGTDGAETSGAALLRGLIDAGERSKVLERISGGVSPEQP